MLRPMRGIMKKCSIIWLLLLLLATAQTNTLNTGTLVLELAPLEKLTGLVWLALYNSSDGFPDGADKVYRSACEKVTAREMRIVIKDLPYGTYAVSAYHDINGNGKMDMGAFGTLEPYGFSNNARAMFSAPPFSKAVFTHNSKETIIAIKLSK